MSLPLLTNKNGRNVARPFRNTNKTAAGHFAPAAVSSLAKNYKLAVGAIRQGNAKSLAGTARVCKVLVLLQIITTSIAPPSR